MVRLELFTEEHLELSDLWLLQDGGKGECFLAPVEVGVMDRSARLLVRALFRLPSGVQLQGLLAYDCTERDVFALQVLTGGVGFALNKYLPEASFEEVLALADHLGIGTGAVLPVRYSVVREALSIPDGHFTLWLGTALGDLGSR